MIASSTRRTLPPGELWASATLPSAGSSRSSVCPGCGHDLEAVESLRAERDRLEDENRALRAELSRAAQALHHALPAADPVLGPRSEERAPTGAVSATFPLSASPHPAAHAAPPAGYSAPPAAYPAPPAGYPAPPAAYAVPPAAYPAPPAPFTPAITALPLGAVAAAGQGIDFGAVSRLSPEELDRLPYGLITLDAQGRVIHYNDTESRLVGLPKERVIGRSFFTEIAPCTRVREFEGRFLELARDPVRVRVQSFDFIFRFARGEQHVSIVLTPARTRGQFHMALVRRAILAT
ncbi:PAS domain-containing protein [Sorangium sp. So ce1389]|uniref:PAS domain-containing protein n=1 Tax=Sorangium sp. So ce1389 TaxID=3133336 RepID=UPI003F6486E0